MCSISDEHMLSGMTNDDLKRSVAARIKRERIAKYRTQEALANQIGKKQFMISRWEHGEMPNYDNLVLLAGAFQITVADLVSLPFVTPPMPDEREAVSS